MTSSPMSKSQKDRTTVKDQQNQELMNRNMTNKNNERAVLLPTTATLL